LVGIGSGKNGLTAQQLQESIVLRALLQANASCVFAQFSSPHPLENDLVFSYVVTTNSGRSSLRLFRKQTKPVELGSILYEALRAGMESEGDLSIVHFLRSLDKDVDEVNEQYAGEVMVGLMFGAVMAIERSASTRVAEQIISGLKLEFLRHLEEQGANAIQRAEWETILADRFLGYRQCLENYSGFEPPWKLGRQFYWNLIGAEEHVAMLIKISTLFILAARDRCQDLLNEYGPSVLVR
jgi:hypothetical protein